MDTIAAIATAPGRAGVAVVRVSGDEAFAIHERLAGRVVAPGRIRFSRICGDDCVVLAFKAPRSYTGEDVVEFQCHGGIVAPRRILDACIAAGARLAGRGEFTRRAFLNGRITWEQAGAILDLIDAKTDRAADAALAGLANERSRELARAYDATLELASQIEYALDVDEEELGQSFYDGAGKRLLALSEELRDAVRRMREGEILRDGALVVFAGAPNAGKSSLFNALVGDSRAIVSPVAGTTRDSIEAWLDIGGWPVRLVDTAGLRDSDDAIETEGVARARALIESADIVLALDEAEALAGAGGTANRPARVINIHAKCDLDAKDAGAGNARPRANALDVSAVTGTGLDALRREIISSLEQLAQTQGAPARDDSDYVARAVAALQNAGAFINAAIASMPDLVLAGNNLRNAASAIAEVTGDEYSSDLLDRLFSRFCVGK